MNDDPTIWHGCYDEGHGELIVGEAYAHPAKFRAGLIDRIYEHGFKEGWWVKGSVLCDPFGGVGIGGIYAAYKGLAWRGVELEPRFCELFAKNVKLHRRRWENAGDPIPVMIQGDSREFSKLVGECGGAVTSPPWQGVSDIGGPTAKADVVRVAREMGKATQDVTPIEAKLKMSPGYGTTPGQIGAMPAGKVDGAVTSPPWQDSVASSDAEFLTPAERGVGSRGGKCNHVRSNATSYGHTKGQIGAMPAGTVDGSVTSPPWEDSLATNVHTIGEIDGIECHGHRKAGHVSPSEVKQEYGESPDNLGNKQGETYWEAVAAVYSEVHKVLKVGGCFAVVVKDYIKQGARVPLCEQTWVLLQQLGFEPVERIYAMNTTETIEAGLWGDVVTLKQRKSFFRLMTERKGSPRIDWEEVLVVRKESDDVTKGANQGQSVES